MKRHALPILFLITALSALSADSRSASVDFVLLVDTSLSMADAMDSARRYAAGEIIGRLVEPGDWVAVLRFYGDTETVWKGDVAGPADVSAIVRSLNGLEANGRFTDIGAALDAMDRLILERGHPDRPKYILLLTDERQEAPKGTRYYSSDYVAHHPLLEYVKRVDMGPFRVITIGYGLADTIEGEARSLMTTLSEPPSRPGSPLAGADASTMGAATATGAGSKISTGGAAGTGATGAEAGAESAGDAAAGGDGTRPSDASGRSAGSRTGFSGAPVAAGLAAAAAVGIVIAFILARRRRNKDDGKKTPTEPIA